MPTKQEALEQLKQIFGDKQLLTVDDVAKIMPMHKQTIYNMLSKDTFPIPVIRMGSKVFIHILDLAEYMAQGEVKPKPKKSNKIDDVKKRLQEQAIYLFKLNLADKFTLFLAEEEQNILNADYKKEKGI